LCNGASAQSRGQGHRSSACSTTRETPGGAVPKLLTSHLPPCSEILSLLNLLLQEGDDENAFRLPFTFVDTRWLQSSPLDARSGWPQSQSSQFPLDAIDRNLATIRERFLTPNPDVFQHRLCRLEGSFGIC